MTPDPGRTNPPPRLSPEEEVEAEALYAEFLADLARGDPWGDRPPPLRWSRTPPDRAGLWLWRAPGDALAGGAERFALDDYGRVRCETDSFRQWAGRQWAGPVPEPLPPEGGP